MGLWSAQLLPRLIDRVLDTPEVMARRKVVCAGLQGTVLEVGFGSGLNLSCYPAGAAEVLAVEPSDTAWRLAQPRITAVSFPVTRVGLDGARIDRPDSSVDAVLSTYTLCTIPDVAGALAELRRILRPGGQLHFLEHGLAPEESVRRWQRRFNPVQRWSAGGCVLDRPIDEIVAASGLEVVNLETGYGDGPRFMDYLYSGRAVRGVTSPAAPA